MADTKDKKPTAGNLRALFKDSGWLKTLRKRMGLGDTLGPLPEECGGTGSESTASAFDQLTFDVSSHIKKIGLSWPSTTYTNIEGIVTHIRQDGSYIRFFISGNNAAKAIDIAPGSTLKSGEAFTASATFSTGSAVSSQLVSAWNCVDREDGGATLYLITSQVSSGVSYKYETVLSITSAGAASVSVRQLSSGAFGTAGNLSYACCGAFLGNSAMAFAVGINGGNVSEILTVSADGALQVREITGDSVRVNTSSPNRMFSSDGKTIIANFDSNGTYEVYGINIETGFAKKLAIQALNYPASANLYFDPASMSRAVELSSSNVTVKHTFDVDSDFTESRETLLVAIMSDSDFTGGYLKYIVPGTDFFCIQYTSSSSSGRYAYLLNTKTGTLVKTAQSIESSPFVNGRSSTVKNGNLVIYSPLILPSRNKDNQSEVYVYVID